MKDFSSLRDYAPRPMREGYIVTENHDVKRVQGFYPSDYFERDKPHPNGRLGAEGQRMLFCPETRFSVSERDFYSDFYAAKYVALEKAANEVQNAKRLLRRAQMLTEADAG